MFRYLLDVSAEFQSKELEREQIKIINKMLFGNMRTELYSLVQHTSWFYNLDLSELDVSFVTFVIEQYNCNVLNKSIIGGIGAGKTTKLYNLYEEDPSIILVEEPHDEWILPNISYEDCPEEYKHYYDKSKNCINLLQAHLHGVSTHSETNYLLFQVSTIASRMRIALIIMLMSIYNIDITGCWKDIKPVVLDTLKDFIINQQPPPPSPMFVKVLGERNILVDTFVFAKHSMYKGMCSMDIYNCLVAGTVDHYSLLFQKGYKTELDVLDTDLPIQLMRIVKRNRPGELQLYFGKYADDALDAYNKSNLNWFIDYQDEFTLVVELRNSEVQLKSMLEQMGIM